MSGEVRFNDRNGNNCLDRGDGVTYRSAPMELESFLASQEIPFPEGGGCYPLEAFRSFYALHEESRAGTFREGFISEFAKAMQNAKLPAAYQKTAIAAVADRLGRERPVPSAPLASPSPSRAPSRVAVAQTPAVPAAQGATSRGLGATRTEFQGHLEEAFQFAKSMTSRPDGGGVETTQGYKHELEAARMLYLENAGARGRLLGVCTERVESLSRTWKLERDRASRSATGAEARVAIDADTRWQLAFVQGLSMACGQMHYPKGPWDAFYSRAILQGGMPVTTLGGDRAANSNPPIFHDIDRDGHFGPEDVLTEANGINLDGTAVFSLLELGEGSYPLRAMEALYKLHRKLLRENGLSASDILGAIQALPKAMLEAKLSDEDKNALLERAMGIFNEALGKEIAARVGRNDPVDVDYFFDGLRKSVLNSGLPSNRLDALRARIESGRLSFKTLQDESLLDRVSDLLREVVEAAKGMSSTANETDQFTLLGTLHQKLQDLRRVWTLLPAEVRVAKGEEICRTLPDPAALKQGASKSEFYRWSLLIGLKRGCGALLSSDETEYTAFMNTLGGMLPEDFKAAWQKIQRASAE